MDIAEATLRWGNTVKSVTGYAVTGNYFDLLGVQPEVGRFIQCGGRAWAEFSALYRVER